MEKSASAPHPAPPPTPGDSNPLIALAARRPVAVLMISVAVFVFGIISLLRLPMNLMPEISYPSITVRTQYPGAAPEDVEDRVSRRLEESLSVVKDLRRISSVSRAEMSDVTMEFSWDTDMKAVLQEVREKIDQTVLPKAAETPSILRYDPSLDPVLQIGLVGDVDLRDLRKVAEDEVQRRLETIPGVAAAKVRGGLEEEIRVEVDEDRIRSRGITMAEISRRLDEENIDQASGLLEEGDVTRVVRTRNELRSLDDIGNIPIRREGGSLIKIRDVANVVATSKDPHVITRIDGSPAVKIEIYREADANIVDLARRLRSRIFGSPEERARFADWKKQLEAGYAGSVLGGKPDGAAGKSAAAKQAEDSTGKIVSRPSYIASYLPAGMRLELLSDPATFIEGSVLDLRNTALLGGLLAILVLYFFLARFSYTAIVAISIPMSVVATFAPMAMFGISLNIMSLGGLALGVGMLVDSSIVVLEAIFRRRGEGAAVMESAIEGASEVGGAVVASTLTTIAVFFPIVFVEGIAGQVFRDQALTVVFSLLASLVVSLTVIPMLAARVGAGRSHQPAIRRRPFRWYLESLRWLRKRFRGRSRAGAALLIALFPVLLPYLALRELLLQLGFLLQGVTLVVFFVVGWCARTLSRTGGGIMSLPLRAFGGAYAATEELYGTVIGWALRHRATIILLAVASLAGAWFLAGRLGSELIPDVAQGELTVVLQYPVGTPLEATARSVQPFEKALAQLPDVASVTSTIGVDPNDIQASGEGEHTARLRLRLREGDENPDIVEKRVLSRAQGIVGDVSDHTYDIERPVLFTFKAPIEVEVRGHDLAKLQELGVQIRDLLAGMPELRDVRTNIARGSQEVHLHPDREKMMRYGVTSRAMADVILAKNSGTVATRFRSGEDKIDVRVQTAMKDRDSVQNLLGLIMVPDAHGGGRTLGDLLTSWELREGPAEIRRVGQQRAAIISARLQGIDLGRVSDEISARIYRNVKIPPDFRVEVAGQKKEMESSRSSLIGALLLAIFLVYVVMASQFESLLQPFIILFTIPLAAVGVTGILFLTGQTLSIMSFIGMIVLAGIVVNNAIVLLDLVNRMRRGGMDTDAALIEAGRRRLRPILMTTMTTVLGMLPLTGLLASVPHARWFDFLLGSGEGAEIRAPLAYAVIGGLISSTLLTLVVIPVVYSLLIRSRVTELAEES